MCMLPCDELVGGESKVYSNSHFVAGTPRLGKLVKQQTRGLKTGSMR